MESKRILLIGVLLFFIVVTLTSISAFCAINGYVLNSTGSLTDADDVNITCLKAGSNETKTPAGLPLSGFFQFFGGPGDDCSYCPNGAYVNASNSTYGLWGENSTSSCGAGTSCQLNVTMFGAAGPTISIVTPTSDYTYTTGTTNYDATCTVGGGSVSEVIFTSNHTGSNTNYTYNGAQVSNPSGNTYRFTMPSLTAGTYLSYEWFCNQTSDGQSDTDGPQGITINQATGVAYARLNGTRANISTGVGTYVNLSAELNTGTGNILLYNNDTLINSGTGTIYNYTLFSTAGIYNISAIYAGNSNYSSDIETWYVNVTADSTIPYFTTIPANASVNYGDTWDVDFDATDDGGNFDSFSVNDSRFTIGATNGTLTNTTFLSAGVYVMNVSINDTQGNTNYTIYKVTVNQLTPSLNYYLNSVTNNASVQYPLAINASASTNAGSLAIYRNASDVTSENGINVSLAAGYYRYDFNVTGNENYSSTSATLYATVSKEDGLVYTYLNNSRANLSIDVGTSIWLNGTLEVGKPASTIYLYNNDTLINFGATPLANYTLFSTAGEYNVSTIYPGNENYTSAIETFYVNVSVNQPPQFTTIPANASVNYGDTWDVDFDATDDRGNFDSFGVNDSRFTIGATNGTLTNATFLSGGIYILNITANDTQGNTNYTIYKVTVNALTPSLSINILPSDSVEYPSQTNVSGNGCPAQITCNLYRDNSPVTNPDVQTLSIGTYSYVYNTTGNENYTSASTSDTLNVTQKTSACDVLFNTSSPVTYPNTFTVWTNCDSSFTLYRNGTVISNNTEQVLGAGVYNFTVIRDDTVNYSNVYDEENFVVSQASPSLVYYLNSVTSDANVNYPNTINASASTNAGSLAIYRNSTDVTAQNNLDVTLAVGYYRYDFNVTGNENYSDTSSTLYATVNQATSEVAAYINNTRSNFTIELGDAVDLNATIITPSTGNIVLFFNNSVMHQGANTISNITQINSYGTYNLTAFYDGNVNYTGDYETWYVIVNDTTAPTFTSISNMSVYDNESVYQDIDATDPSGINCFDVNDTDFTIDCSGVLQNATSLSLGMHWLNITVNDNLGNENYSIIYVNVSEYPDNVAPYFTSIPANATLTYGQSLNVDFDAVDDAGNFEGYYVNDTRFSINLSGGLVNTSSLGVGIYLLNVSINDTSGNMNYTMYQVTVNQASVSLDITITPSNSVTYPTQTSADASGCPGAISCNFYRNDTGSIADPDTVTLGVGVYNYTYNTSGNANYSADSYSELLTVSQNNSDCGVYFSVSSPVTYPATFNVYTNCTSGYLIYRNGSSIANGSLQSLAAGTYNFTVIRNDQNNYSNVYYEQNFVVSKATSEIAARLNGSRANISTENGTYINLSAQLITGSGSIKLYKEGTLINQGSGLIYNNTLFDSINVFNISAVYDGNENYTSDIETWYVNSTQPSDTTLPNISFVAVTTAAGNYVQDYIEANVTSSDDTGISLVEINLYNTSLVSSQSNPSENYSYNFTSLSDGTYYLNATANDTSNNQNSTETRTIVLDNTGPSFTNLANQLVYDNASLSYDINASDAGVGVECFSVNDTNFSITCAGVLTNATSLTVGDFYVLNITVNDTLGNINYGTITINATVLLCGNGIIDAGEQCDGSNITATCISLGYKSGSLSCTASCTYNTGGCSSGGGGGGGGTTPDEVEEVDPFDVSPDNLILDLNQGESTTEIITITNNLGEKLDIVIDYGALDEFVYVSDAVITLDAYEEREVEVEIDIDEDTPIDSYIGKIEVRGDGEEKDLEMILNVKERPEKALFDIFTSMITRRVNPGSDAIAKIELTNVGDIDATDVTLYYSIVDFDNMTITSDKERLSIGDGLTVHRELYLPEDETDTYYVFYARVTYPGGYATSADTFTTSSLPNWSLFLITVLIILASTITTIILHRRNVALIGQGV